MSGKSKKVEVVGRAFFLFPRFQLGRVKGLCKQGRSSADHMGSLAETYLGF